MKKMTMVCAGVMLGLAAWGAAIPPAVQKLLEDNLPLSFYAMPKATRATKVYPLESMNKRIYKKQMSVKVAEDQLVLLEFSPDKKVVNCAFPVGSNGDYLPAWFKVEDVFDLGQLKLSDPVEYVVPTGTVRHFIYQARATGAPNLVDCVRNVDGAKKIGERHVQKGERRREVNVYNLLFLTSGSAALGEYQLAARLVLERDIPEFKDEDYRTRIAEMGSEYAYRTGRFWDNGTHPIVVHNGNGGCAAFATDFAGYIFDAHNFNTGAQYEDPEEVRAGDVIRIEGHYITVVERYADGRLLTWDGNCNHAIRRSTSAYSVVNGEFRGGKFVKGWHYLKKDPGPPPDPSKHQTKKKN